MIIDNTYFKGDIYIPHAKPSITDSITGVDDEIIAFINEYARECLYQSLGPVLFAELDDNLDSTQPDGLSIAADAKWDELLNGTTYVDPVSGETLVWRGIRYKSNPAGEYDKSFLANYVYFYYERNAYITRTDAGHVKENSKNSFNVAPTLKVTTAWNKFVDAVQGKENKPRHNVKYGLLLVDYYDPEQNLDVSMKKFINDSNEIEANKYMGYSPRTWNRLNRFGI